jgi:hypothetical protein
LVPDTDVSFHCASKLTVALDQLYELLTPYIVSEWVPSPFVVVGDRRLPLASYELADHNEFDVFSGS